MRPRPSSRRDRTDPPAPGEAGGRLGAAALAVMLACLAARGLLSEMPWDASVIHAVKDAGGDAALHARRPNPSRPIRVVLACALLSSAGLWLLGRARAGSVEIRHRWLGVLMGVFALWSLASSFGAANRRAAWTGWIEQVSLLVGCFTAVQMCRRRRARDLLLSAAVAACVVLAAKSAWQMAFEFPVNHGEWRQHSAELLRQAGHDPDSPDARMLAARMLADTPYGFMNLSNPFGSLMIVLGFFAAGLAVEKFAASRATRPVPGAAPPGEIHLPAMAAALTAAVAAAAGVVVLLTRSRGAIVAMVVAAAGAYGVSRYRRALGRHWRKALLIVAAVVALAAAAVAGYGLEHDRLPTKTMTFRWYYWTGAAGIIAERPVFGTGGGNFPGAYLRHRRAEAEEAVKMPHNFVIHALCQYGVPGGVCLVAVVAYVLCASARPGEGASGPGQAARGEKDPAAARPPAAMFAGAAALALVGRWLFYIHNPSGGALVFVLDVLCPALLLAGALAFAYWQGGAARRGGPVSATARVLLVCGLAGFVLHNAVTFSMWMPGAATVFWVLGGLCLSQAPAGRPLRLVRARWPAALVAVVLIAAVALLQCPPAVRAYLHARDLAAAVRAGNLPAALAPAGRAAEADPSSAMAAVDAAMVAAHAAANAPSEHQARTLGRARHWARQAVLRDETNAEAHKVAGTTLFRPRGTGQQWRDSLGHFERATELDPMNMRLRLTYAWYLLKADRHQACVGQLRRVRDIDRSLPEESMMRLTDAENSYLDELLESAEAGAG